MRRVRDRGSALITSLSNIYSSRQPVGAGGAQDAHSPAVGAVRRLIWRVPYHFRFSQRPDANRARRSFVDSTLTEHATGVVCARDRAQLTAD